MHDDRIENWSTVWQLKNEDDGEDMPNCVRGCGDRIEGEGGYDSAEVMKKWIIDLFTGR